MNYTTHEHVCRLNYIGSIRDGARNFSYLCFVAFASRVDDSDVRQVEQEGQPLKSSHGNLALRCTDGGLLRTHLHVVHSASALRFLLRDGLGCMRVHSVSGQGT